MLGGFGGDAPGRHMDLRKAGASDLSKQYLEGLRNAGWEGAAP